jgi:hypothetical protein
LDRSSQQSALSIQSLKRRGGGGEKLETRRK